MQHPVQKYTKMQISDKRYLTNTTHTFWGTWTTSALRYFSLDHFGKPRTKICLTHEKKLEEADFVDKEFQDKKISNNDFYMWIMVCYRR